VGEGAAVGFCDVDADVGGRTATEIGDRVRFYACDIGVEDQVRETAERCERDLGRVTVLVNNAGVNANFESTAMTSEEWGGCREEGSAPHG